MSVRHIAAIPIPDPIKRQQIIADRTKDKNDELARVRDFNKDVITIRNRRGWHSGTVTLFEILDFLHHQGFIYAGIHCVFCRDLRSGKNESWSADLNTGVEGMIRTR